MTNYTKGKSCRYKSHQKGRKTSWTSNNTRAHDNQTASAHPIANPSLVNCIAQTKNTVYPHYAFNQPLTADSSCAFSVISSNAAMSSVADGRSSAGGDGSLTTSADGAFTGGAVTAVTRWRFGLGLSSHHGSKQIHWSSPKTPSNGAHVRKLLGKKTQDIQTSNIVAGDDISTICLAPAQLIE